MREIEIDGRCLVPADGVGQGVYSFIAAGSEVEGVLQDQYGRNGLCLKVFKGPACSVDEFRWGDGSLLTDCTRAQNLFARHGLAPRVFDLVKVGGHVAQVTEFILDDDAPWKPERAEAVQARYGIKMRWDMNTKNFIGSKLTDFQSASFADPTGYERSLVERARTFAAWGSRPEPYQSLEAFGEAGQRDMASRVAVMRLDDVEWAGRTVLDLGCNLGAFCHEALRRGAVRVVGVDLPEVADLAFEVANWLGAWGADFYGMDMRVGYSRLAEVCGLAEFDIVLALSVDRQIGYGPWMADVCREVFYLEGHVPDREETYRDRLERDFGRVEFLGYSRDHGVRPVFRCWKG